jgi:hypothetical protein
MDDLGLGEWMAFEERVEAIPEGALRARSSFQPLALGPGDLLPASPQLPDAPRDAVIGIVTNKLRRQPGVLPSNGLPRERLSTEP